MIFHPYYEIDNDNMRIQLLMDQSSEKEMGEGSTPVIKIVERDHLSDEENIAYFHEYTQILETASFIHRKIIDLHHFKDSLAQTLSHLQQTVQENFLRKSEDDDYIIPDQRPKRTRRVNSMIEKKFVCGVRKCGKVYGSEGSLHQHVKIKHREGVIVEEEEEDESFTLRSGRRERKRRSK